MARDTYYFQHDYNARNDKKLKALIKNHGAAGYGVYWVTVEMLHEEDDSCLEMDEIQYDLLSDETKLEVDQVKAIIDDCVNKLKLFIQEDNILKSNRVDRNKDKRNELKEKRRQAGKKGSKARWGDSKPMANDSKGIASANSKIANDGKGKERKGKEKKEESTLLQISGTETKNSAIEIIKECRPDIQPSQIEQEVDKLLQKYPMPSENLVIGWAKNIQAKPKMYKMRNPQTGAIVEWDEAKYNRLIEVTEYKEVG